MEWCFEIFTSILSHVNENGKNRYYIGLKDFQKQLVWRYGGIKATHPV